MDLVGAPGRGRPSWLTLPRSMGLLASELATVLALPLGASLCLALLALLLLLLRRRRLGGACLVASVLLLWLASTPLVSTLVRGRMEARFPPVAIGETEPAAAIAVLGGGLAPRVPPRLWVDLGAAGDRVLHAARLHRAGRAPVVIATWGNVPWRRQDRPAVPAARELLLEWGVPEEALVLEKMGPTTRSECVNLRRILDERGIKGDVLLVTSALHMRRALAACRTAGVPARPAATDYEVTRVKHSLLDLVPDAYSLEGSNRAVKELLGYWVYRMRGWIGPES